jgi:hypothetical protein
MICSAQEEPPQRRKFNEDESCKILTVKIEKNKLKRVPGWATNFFYQISKEIVKTISACTLYIQTVPIYY